MQKLAITFLIFSLFVSHVNHARQLGPDVQLSKEAQELIDTHYGTTQEAKQATAVALEECDGKWVAMRWFRAPSEIEIINWYDNCVLENLAVKFGGAIHSVPMPVHDPFAQTR